MKNLHSCDTLATFANSLACQPLALKTTKGHGARGTKRRGNKSERKQRGQAEQKENRAAYAAPTGRAAPRRPEGRSRAGQKASRTTTPRRTKQSGAKEYMLGAYYLRVVRLEVMVRRCFRLIAMTEGLTLPTELQRHCTIGGARTLDHTIVPEQAVVVPMR